MAWHETNAGDLVSLVIDQQQNKIHSAASLGYRGDDADIDFESGEMHGWNRN